MPSQAYVGRVGGLAVALGLGAVIVTGWSSGLAWADESGGAAGSTASSPASGTKPAKASSNATGADDGSPGRTRGTATSGDTREDDAVTKDDAVRSAPMGVVVGTGGLRQDASAGSGKRGTTNGFDPAGAKPVSIAPPVSTATQAKPDTTPSPTATHEYSADTVSVQITSTPSWDPNLTSALTPPEPSPSNVVGVVSKMVSGVVSAVLNPFAATDTPGAPADAPSMWALLAVARREFENALQSPSVTDAAVNLQTTSETVPDAACNPNGAR